MTEYRIRTKRVPELTRTLKRGCQGDDVFILQTRLIEIGFYLGTYGADGYFGGRTRDAVDDFLCAYGLEPTGEIKVKGWELLFGEHRFAQFHDAMFKCLCRENGHKTCDGYYNGGINPAIKIMLARVQDKMRERIGISNLYIVIKSNLTAHKGNGGYRCPRWNRRCDGETYSQHLYAKAADTYPAIDDVPMPKYFDLLFECASDCNPFGGVGTGAHTDRINGVCHIDVRGTKSRWKYAR